MLQNKDSVAAGTFDGEILKVYDVQEIRRNPIKLVCGGLAKTPSQGDAIVIEYFIEEDRDGDAFFGYEFVAKLSRATSADEQLVEELFLCNQENQQFRQMLRESGGEFILDITDAEFFREIILGILDEGTFQQGHFRGIVGRLLKSVLDRSSLA